MELSERAVEPVTADSVTTLCEVWNHWLFLMRNRSVSQCHTTGHYVSMSLVTSASAI